MGTASECAANFKQRFEKAWEGGDDVGQSRRARAGLMVVGGSEIGSWHLLSLVELSWVVSSHKVYGGTGSESVVRTVDTKTKTVWVQGVDTSNLVDGAQLSEDNFAKDVVFKADGTKTYRVNAGSNTVPLLTRIDTKSIEDYFSRAGSARVWNDSTGKHSFKAIFVKFNKGRVRLVSMEGKSKDVELDRLSEPDQDFVRSQLQAQRKARTAAQQD